MFSLLRNARERARRRFFTPAEEAIADFRGAGRALFMFLAAVLIVSSVALLYLLESSVTVPAPARGGSLTEGIVGAPRFINPVLALSDADRDMTALVYSGLTRATPTGEYLPDLAQSYEASQDGLTYTFVLRPTATFHDGKPVTADDVVFTIRKAQASAIKSPVRANWDGVVVEKVDQHTVRFTLRSPYAPFIQNTTLGILPAHLWQGVSDEEFPFSELNANPVGSGPYKVASVSRSQGGIPAAYTLAANGAYALGEPYLSKLVLRFYQTEAALAEALEQGDVESGSGLSAESLAKVGGTPATAALNRVFGVFFNQNQSEVLRNKDVRAALSAAVDRNALVTDVLGGYGTPLTGPVPPSLIPAQSAEPVADAPLVAQQMLLDKGWELENGVLVRHSGKGDTETTRLSLTLATGNVPELREAAQYLRESWGRMGAEVVVEVYEAGDLTQNIIRPRKYDALLFGEVIGRELDLFAFWHSSQRNDPGLNIALYANATADDALEALRRTQDGARRIELYQTFAAELAKDVPAVFLYAPDFVYSVPNDLKGLNLGLVETPSDRFLSVQQWHREVDYVWPVFATGSR